MGEAAAKEIGGLFCHVNVISDAEVEAGFKKASAGLSSIRLLSPLLKVKSAKWLTLRVRAVYAV